ncbi:hypothetical protein C1H76_8147 [Elsinoe australis]|uniref:Rhodopsin domain-containing protein n=1 Tax=Elsinoe australis TaxID=40998 RepID=A0A4U7AT52_9PEZI|nr:hypothetical protein C1H76_8147 [Elsinoe australis]
MSSSSAALQGDALPHEVLVEFPILRSLGIALLVVVTLCYVLRLYVKLAILRTFRSDDIALAIAYLLFWPLGVINILFAGWGLRLNAGELDVLKHITTAAIAYNSIYVACAVSCKISVMLLVRSLLGPHDKKRRTLAYGITGISTLLGVVYFAFCFTCGVTDTAKTSTTCTLYGASNGVSLAWSFSNTAANIIFASLCVSLIWSATMSLRTRIIASGLLSFSSVGAIASALRIATILGWGWTTFDGQRLHVTRWSLIEAGICISAICLASLRPLLKKLSLEKSSYAGTGDQYKSASKGGVTFNTNNRANHGDEIPLKIGVQTVFEVEEQRGGSGELGMGKQHSVSVA